MRHAVMRAALAAFLLTLTAAGCGPTTLEGAGGDGPPEAPWPEAVPTQETAGPLEAAPSREAPAPGLKQVELLVPTSDVGRDDVAGVPSRNRLFPNVNDGTSPERADDGRTYVTLRSGYRSGFHTVGFSGGPQGPLVEVEVHVRARRSDSRGTLQVELFDGARSLGRGTLHTLGNDWRNFSDTFTGLSVGSASSLRARVRLVTTSGRGGLRYTQLWVRVTAGQQPPRPPLRMDVFLLRELSTCVIGNRCTAEPCARVHSNRGGPDILFAQDDAFRAVRPDDPAVGTAQVVQCLRTVLTDAEVAAKREEIARMRDNVALWTGGDVQLDLRFHEIAFAETSMSPRLAGLNLAPEDLRPVALPFLSRETDFVAVTHGVRDTTQGLYHDIGACGLAYGVGLAGTGMTWVPETEATFGFQCATQNVYTHEFLHNVHFDVHALSGFDDLYDGNYPACGQGDPDTRRWFPDTHDCARDPDFPNCGTEPCGTNDFVNEHVLRAHWPPRGMQRFVTNHCRNGVQDFGETGVDSGGPCLPPELSSGLAPTLPPAVLGGN